MLLLLDHLLLGVSGALLTLLAASVALFAQVSMFIDASLGAGSLLCFLAGVAVNCRIKQSWVAMHIREEHHQLVATQSADLIALATPDGYLCYASPSFRSILGFDPAVVIGKPIFQDVHPADMDEVSTHFARIIIRGIDQATFRLRHADGTWRWIETHGARATNGDDPALVLVGRDITERRHRDTDLLHLQKLDSFGRMAGTAMHEINNLLTGIGGVASLSLQAPLPDPELHGDLLAIKQAASRASGLARQLLAFAHKSTFAPRLLDLNVLINELTHLLQRTLGVDIDYRLALTDDLIFVRGDRAHLEQVVINLAMNARDAMPNGGKLTIETTHVLHNTSATDEYNSDQAEAYARLMISDTGMGMDSFTQAHLFEPFFTTKAPGHGTGLGLSTCATIIKEHGGTIQIDSTPGSGTTVTIDLPVVPEVHCEAKATAEQRQHRTEWS